MPLSNLLSPARLARVNDLHQMLNSQRSAGRAMRDLAWRHTTQIGDSLREAGDGLNASMDRQVPRLQARLAAGPQQLATDWWAYWQDAAERMVLTMDTLRQRGNAFVEHEAAGMPPVLEFDYTVLMDGRNQPRPVNYSLLRITPPEGVQIDDAKRPFMIVDPRAGHGAGIGGFKPDSQVGEAFADGHPVYFVVFHPIPEPGQTLADVRDAEVAFLAEVARRHPNAPRPAVIGNCQGGWATMVLAASAPDLVGPVVINGAPMSYWAGTVGKNPMRYLGGLRGGATPALLMSDLGNGIFDGSWLVSNFEELNPANTYVSKTYNLYSRVDTEGPRFIEFERWWGGFFLMNEEEIRWIVENLFVGNRLARGDAVLGGERIDLRRIHSPIIVFASHGDNITPPQQALNWIADLYHDVEEIKAHGQRIIYMVHESVGHLGIFVSGKIATREHNAITDTICAIEALPPGLYEMRITDGEDRMHVAFEPRTIDDLLRHDDGREDEQLFAAVARLSEFGTELYDMTVRPVLKAMVQPKVAKVFRDMQPLRSRRVLWSEQVNPFMSWIGMAAEQVRAQRHMIDGNNPFAIMEHATVHWMEAQLNLFRDVRDAMQEMTFHAIYNQPAMRMIGDGYLRDGEQRRRQDLSQLPEVRDALANISSGGAAAGTVRMLCLLAGASGGLRRSLLERQIAVFAQSELFGHLSASALDDLVREQSLIVNFAPEQALKTLPDLLDGEDARRAAFDALNDVLGERSMTEPAVQVFWNELEKQVRLGKRVTTARSPRLERAQGEGLGESDDLILIRGVGSLLAEKLAELGFTRFAQIAMLDDDEQAWLDQMVQGRGRVQREKWVEQARELAARHDASEAATDSAD